MGQATGGILPLAIGVAISPLAVGWQLGPRVRVVQTAYFEYLHAERLEPSEKPVQGRLIPERAMQDCLDRLH